MIEGVMMRNGNRYAVAVRTADQQIVVDTQECGKKFAGNKFVKLPIVRGVVNFFDSLILGMKTLMFSASCLRKRPKKNDRRERDEGEAEGSEKGRQTQKPGKDGRSGTGFGEMRGEADPGDKEAGGRRPERKRKRKTMTSL